MSLPDLPSYQDGDYTTPVAIARTPYRYPFAALGDTTTKVYTRTYLVNGEGYTPAEPGDVDPDLAGHYLVVEEPLDWTRGPHATLRRTYASIPTQQVEWGSVAYTKPELPTLSTSTTNYFYDLDKNLLQALSRFYTNNGLWRWGANTIYGPSQTVTSVTSGSNTRITATAHGVSGSDNILIYGTLTGLTVHYVVEPADYSVIDANTIDILGYNLTNTVTALFPFTLSYVPGADRIRTKRITDFYLPGVTSGITTPADIPIVSPAFDDAAFLALITSGATGLQDYDAEPLSRWLDGPIYQQTTIQIDLDDL